MPVSAGEKDGAPDAGCVGGSGAAYVRKGSQR
jgi:hypothetical protein